MKIPQLAALGAACLCLSACLSSGLPDMGQVPAFHLTNQDGQQYASTAALANKVWVADFIFTTCHGPCPRMTAQMHKLQEQTKEFTDVELVSFTVDPATDTPEVLSAYAKQFKADPEHWTFLTGPADALNALSYDTFHLGSVGAGKLEHSTRFVLIDRKGRIRGYYDTSDATALPQLVEDIGKVRKEVL
ncbi:SCO family protein [uncultured Paludibaculum sp.]|uniref:SCO family protein n=1 Tax=uncultured Paludibaculum sp. TaxID=1765020 RepID=UPI002AAC0E06|nr:SCO family protein [uncultured Paludibaculum sp.]